MPTHMGRGLGNHILNLVCVRGGGEALDVFQNWGGGRWWSDHPPITLIRTKRSLVSGPTLHLPLGMVWITGSANNAVPPIAVTMYKCAARSPSVARRHRLLCNGYSLLAPGGFLVYSTCSLNPAQNEDVVVGAFLTDESLSRATIQQPIQPEPTY